MRTVLILLVSLLVLAGCGVTEAPQPPNLRLEQVELVQLGLQEQRFRLRLEVENPNAIPLPIEHLTYRLSLNGILVGSGETDESARLAAGERRTLDLSLSVDSVRLLGQFSEWTRSPPDAIGYLIETEMRLGLWPRPLQISHEGRTDLRIASGAFGR